MTTRWEIRVDEANPEEEIPLTENGRIVLERRYLRKGPDGRPVETIPQMFRRVARAIAEAEKELGGDPALWEERFYQLLTSLRFLPNSPTFTGAGTPLGQLAACFVLPLEDDMGKIPGGIFQTLRDAALIQQTGGGNGFSFSRLRPKNAIVFSSMGRATGPVGFLRVYDRAFGEIAQGGSRRGANMAVLRVDHPDIEEFITCKTDENAITNFNISVGITDAFMRAVENDEEWELRFPDVLHPAYRNFRGTLEDAERAGIPIRVYKRVRARDLFRKIATQAHHNGEPGVLFLDTANRSNPVPHLYTLEATNPCGEQWLGPYENCCLGSVNLARHVKYVNGKAEVDWEKLRETVEWATRFLDNVVQVNQYVPAVPQLKEAAFKTRRIGLGFMGLADLMYHLRIRYGSEEGQEFAAQIAEFIRYHAMRTSIELARERGPFPAIRGSIYDPEDLKWEPPKPLKPYTRDWGRPPLDWNAIVEGIRRHGIRNAAQTTVAPTGCLVAGTMIITDRGLLPIEALGDPNGPQWQDVDWVVASEGGPRRATKFYVNGVAHTLRLVTR
ncbi:adenosylcobalamin-dependent ribonucleoside-diphosphate reductase, partial [Thermoflexus sp.]|uniref:adenosylcobalamin-dependent ribonucleoside-diphosphate reductase n=1 Tax=Thermoflexus sp. TaxID=1969742 RepID=UPI00262ED9A4